MIPLGADPKWPRIRIPASRRPDFTSPEWKAIKRAEHQVRLAGPVCDRCAGEHDTKDCREPITIKLGEHWGTRKWRELHLRTLQGAEGFPAWLEGWLGSIKACGGCQKHTRAWVEANPPDLADPFAWGVLMHNATNRHLKRAEMPVAEARALWQQQAGIGRLESQQAAI
jgi:hypothetical protein